MKVEVAVLDAPSLKVLTVFCELCKATLNLNRLSLVRAEELCVKVEVAMLGSPSLMVLKKRSLWT